jgi:hypothetical protein
MVSETLDTVAAFWDALEKENNMFYKKLDYFKQKFYHCGP